MRKEQRAEYDVVVLGGGMGGVAAAIEAAGEGARTLLVEQSGQFGGVGTNALITSFSQMPLPGKPRPTFVEKILDVMRGEGTATQERRSFSAEHLVVLLDQWVLDSGATPLFFTTLVDLVQEGRRVEEVILHHKSGFLNVKAPIFVDATGDGDLCWLAGAAFEQGDGESPYGQPMTLAFYVSGIEEERVPPREEIQQRYLEAKASGTLSNPRENLLAFRAVEPGTWMLNTTRILHRDGTDGFELTLATLEGRRQVMEMFHFLKAIPGFERAVLQRIANRIGVRETRRFICDYRLTYDAMRRGERHPDAVMVTDAYIDIHNPHGTGTRVEPLPEGVCYDVPLRALLPVDLDNVIIGSRCIGTSHEAFSAVRMMPHVAEYGRAAGLAAAWAARTGRPLREVEHDWLQRKLGTLGVL